MEKENINGANQLATAKQKGKKVNEKQQQETAAKSPWREIYKRSPQKIRNWRQRIHPSKQNCQP